MEATEFKNKIKEVKNFLKGITIQFKTTYSVRPYYTLKEFGEAILKQEKFGKSFSFGQVWTVDGIEFVKSFQEFSEILMSGKVTGIRIEAFDASDDVCDAMRSFGSLD